MLLAERARSERLAQIIKELQRHRFGRRAESLPEDQLLLALEEVEQALSEAEAIADAEVSSNGAAKKDTKRRVNRGALPEHLPRVEMIVEDKTCRCCGGALHPIGEDRAERLDVIPAQFRVLVVRRPKYACRACEEVVVQGEMGKMIVQWTIIPSNATARVIEGGLPTEATIAHVLVAKYADHLPLYRQAQIYARQGIQLDRSTLADWVGRAAWLLRPICDRLFEVLKTSEKLFADETTAPVLDPGRGTTKTGQLWAYARGDRPWGGEAPPGVIYVYAPDRKAERPMAHLGGFRGILQVDGYAGYRPLAEKGAVRLALCWAHVRRKFYELAAAGNAPIADEALKRIAEIYHVETPIRGKPADERRAARDLTSRPMVESLKLWLDEQIRRISGKSRLAEAIRYALTLCEGLPLFLDDGRVEIDNDTVERAIRPLALTRKNALFAGSDGGTDHWAVVASLIETCKLAGVEPQAYLTDVLTRIVADHPNSRIDELLPWAYAPPARLLADVA